jgi:ketosteroid isomerase-like protein
VLVVAVEHGRGSASEAPVSSRIHTVYTFRAGKILRYQEFYDEGQALEALGLSEGA